MSKINKDTLTYLGNDFEIRLLAQIVKDLRFGNNIIDILDPNYFSDEYLRIIAAEIKEAKEVDDIVPDLPSLRIRLFNRINEDIKRKYIISNLLNIENASLYDSLKIQEIALTFCKQQELKKSIKKIQKIIDNGNIEDYSECEFILRKALEHGDNRDDSINVLDNYKDILVEDFRKPIKTGISGLDEIMNGGLAKGELGVILAPFGVGKAGPNSSKIYTPNGFTTYGEIKTDDLVIGSNGKSQKVIGVYPQGKKEIFKVSFNDDTFTYCCKEHLWFVTTENNEKKVISTEEIINNFNQEYVVPIVKPIEFFEKEVNIHPYVFGLLINNKNKNISVIDLKDVELISKINSYHETIVNTYFLDVEVDDVLVKKEMKTIKILYIDDEISAFKLAENRTIPDKYLYNSLENRIQLLQGILDGYGTCLENGKIKLQLNSKTLAKDVRDLVLSLGMMCNLVSLNDEHELLIEPINNGFSLFTVKEKLKNIKFNDNQYKKYITEISFSHSEEATCIMVENNDHLYVTDDYILTHNTTMITKLANTAMNEGKNVLQIFFEDMPKIIQRKHISCWTGIDLNNLSLNKEEIIKFCEEKQKESKNGKGQLKLKKFSSDGTTIPIVKQYIRKKISEGFKPDIVLLDYIDCVQPSKQYDDNNVGEGSVMRQFESMLAEFDIAGWTAVQGNRCIWVEEIVTIKNIGDIKIGDVKIGDEILTKEGYKQITYVFPKEKQKVFEIVTKSGKKLRVSEKHRFPSNTTDLVSISTGLSVGHILLTKKDETNYHDLIEDEIESISFFGVKETIDITVKDTHMFFANDIYTHNSSIKANIVEADQMGGSIKKGQIGHFIVSIAKTLPQKENGTATMAILKSRFGKDGIVFEDIVFDNAKIQIDMNSNSLPRTRVEHIKTKEDNDRLIINEILYNKLRNKDEE
jgi:hypothetical protein